MISIKNIIDIKYEKGMGITGITDEFFSMYVKSFIDQKKKNVLIVVNSLYEANKLYEYMQNYTKKASLFPMDDFLTSEAIAVSPDLKVTRLETINKIVNNDTNIIITNLMGYLRFLPTKEVYKKSFLTIKKGETLSPENIVTCLNKIGYKKESLVTKTGEYATRGYIIDVFPISADNPIRIEFFGEDIESIRVFDIESQKSISKIDAAQISPYTEFLVDKELEEILNQKYLPQYGEISSIANYIKDLVVVYKDYEQLEAGYKQIMVDVLSYQKEKDKEFNGQYMYDFNSILPKDYFYYMSINNILKDKKVFNYRVGTIGKFNDNQEKIEKYLLKCIRDGKTVVIFLESKQSIKAINKLNLDIKKVTIDKIIENRINLVEQNITEGFTYKDFVFISEGDLFKKIIERKQYNTKFKYSSKLDSISSLNKGDYVVHYIHGIGIYNGIKALTSEGITRDYIEVLYQGTDKLFIPVEKIDLLSKYVSKEGTVPRINKLDSILWRRTKNAVMEKVRDLADKLLSLYAERESKKGFSFSPDSLLQKEFEQACPFELTTDQKIAIEQIKKDMEKASPMDRLLCGDVGFGKTEVAFQVVFKAIGDSKQVVFLCPTTILSNQHYENALKRFSNFPVNIALLNRFTSQKEVKRIKDGLKDGTIDLVFGTHRLLSNDIDIKDLGLLIIDEEQRFGVLHKEKIKEYKSTIDVLTLTATPIPRTLQMSLVGIRSLSLIETPPVNRYPIETYVIEENRQIIKDAIYKELSREGQIYILYNRIDTIEQKVEEIKNLAPDARITYIHGRMSKTLIEKQMLEFVNKEYDILICTTIIETGIDIENVNTLIILDADRYGLSQLYQIRGRVGRSNKIAYAYLMYQPFKQLNEVAIKRLNVIKEFTELGSGFKIAARDLSIRGAGDILGKEQAGFIDTVGIDFYLKLLEEEMARKRGEEVVDIPDEKPPLLNIPTHIPDQYVSDEELKIAIHKEINTIDSKEKLQSIKNEFEDRFGKLTEDILVYMHEEWFEKQVKNLGIKRVRQTKNTIEMTLEGENIKRLDFDDIFMKSFEITPMFRFKSHGEKVVIILDTIKLEKHPIYYLTELLDYIIKKY